jgi:hypothetical protein
MVFSYSAKDYELESKWRADRGKHNTKFVDETKPDPLADEESWIYLAYGIHIKREYPTELPFLPVSEVIKESKKRKPLTKKERIEVLDNAGHACEKCGKEEDLQIHHIDEDRSNNRISNLEVLCYTCHKKRHRKKVAPEAAEYTDDNESR